MSFTGIPLGRITEKDLQALVENKVRENKVLEYKDTFCLIFRI
jgi:hypothetical protein